MTLALVASPAAQSNSTTTVSTNTFTPPAGSLMVALVGVGNPSKTATTTTGTVTDSAGTTWTLKKRQNSANSTGAAEVWMADAGSNPSPRQVTLTGSKAGVLLSVVLFTGAQPVASQTGSTVGSTATSGTLAITPTAVGSYIVGSASETRATYTMGAAAASTVIAAYSDATNVGAYGSWRSTTTTRNTGSQTYGVTPTPTNETEKVAVEILASPPPSFGVVPSPAAQATSTTSVSTNVFTPLAGSLMVALVGVGNPSNTTTATTATVTDTVGSTWTLKRRQNSATGTGAAEVWMTDVGTSPVPMQVTLTGSKAGVSLSVILFAGAQPAAAQTGATAGSASTTANTLAITPTVIGSYIVGAASDTRAAYTMTGAASTTLIAAYSDTTNVGAYGSWRSTSTTASTSSQTYGVTPAPSNETEKAAVEILPYPPVSGLTDDFATQDSTKWTGWAAGQVAWLSGPQQVQITPTTSYYTLSSSGIYTLANSAAFAQLTQAPDVGNGSTEAFLQMVDTANSDNFFSIGFSGGGLVMTEQVAQVASDVGITYDAVAHNWLRLRHDGSNIIWETSPDGATWTVQRSKPPAIPFTSMRLHLTAGYWGTETSPGVAIFDSVNTFRATALTTSAALSGSGSLTAVANSTQGGGGSALTVTVADNLSLSDPYNGTTLAETVSDALTIDDSSSDVGLGETISDALAIDDPSGGITHAETTADTGRITDTVTVSLNGSVATSISVSLSGSGVLSATVSAGGGGGTPAAVATPRTGLQLRSGSSVTLRSDVALRAGSASAVIALSTTAALSGLGTLDATAVKGATPSNTVSAAFSGAGTFTATKAGIGTLPLSPVYRIVSGSWRTATVTRL